MKGSDPQGTTTLKATNNPKRLHNPQLPSLPTATIKIPPHHSRHPPLPHALPPFPLTPTPSLPPSPPPASMPSLFPSLPTPCPYALLPSSPESHLNLPIQLPHQNKTSTQSPLRRVTRFSWECDARPWAVTLAVSSVLLESLSATLLIPPMYPLRCAELYRVLGR